jgi:hypothetical protein
MKHERKCWSCGNVAEHEDNVVPHVLCKQCGSQDTRLTKKPEGPPTIADLGMLVARLVQQVRKHDPENDVATKAMDYLRRKDLQGSILREMTYG